MKDRFEHIIQDKLQDFSMKAEPGDWTAIERSLGLKVRKPVPLFRYVTAAAAVLIVAVLGFYIARMERQTPDVAPLVAEATSLIKEMLPLADIPKQEETQALEAVRKLKQMVGQSNGVQASPVSIPATTTREATVSTQVTETRPATHTAPQGSQPAQIQTDKAYANYNSAQSRAYDFPPARTTRTARRRSNSNWALALFANSVSSIEMKDYDGDIKQLSYESPSMVVDQSDEFIAGLALNAVVEYEKTNGLLRAELANWNHATPLAFGALVRHNFTDFFGVETGLTYTYHSSKAQTTSIDFKQQLHYIGVPLAVTLTPLRAKNFDFYGKVGGAADFNVAGRIKSTYGSGTTNTDRFTKSGVQWSASANLGLMYNITPMLGFYIEPGVSHYFEFSNQPESYWKEHPTNINLKIGVRTTF